MKHNFNFKVTSQRYRDGIYYKVFDDEELVAQISHDFENSVYVNYLNPKYHELYVKVITRSTEKPIIKLIHSGETYTEVFVLNLNN